MFQPLNAYSTTPLPQTVEEAVDLLYEDISLRDRVVMSKLSEEELDTNVYLSIAKMLRKEFGLYSRNQALITSCRSYLGTIYDSHEDLAMVIIKELWRKVKRVHTLRLVKNSG